MEQKTAERGDGMRVSDAIRRALPAPVGALKERSAKLFARTGRPAKNRSPYEGFSWMGNVWLVYSVFFIVDPIHRHSRQSWIALAVVYPVFLVIYFSFYRVAAAWIYDKCANQPRLLVALSMFVLGMGYIPWNSSASGIIVYAAAYLPFIFESIPVIMLILSAGSALLALEGYLLHLTTWSWLTGVIFGCIVAISNLAVARQHRADRKLRMAHEEIEHLAKVAERERIARDLHDVLGHTLSVIVLKSELAGRLIDRDPARMAREIADVEQIARKALAEVREAIGGYRADGLVAEIERAHAILDAAGVQLRCESKPPQLSPAEETVLSLILREAVTNIVRHAQASRCEVTFFDGEAHHALVIRDNGRGGIYSEGNGLRGMRERVEALGGRFCVDASEGTRLSIQLPIAAPLAQALDSKIAVHALPTAATDPGAPRELPALSTQEIVVS